MHNDLFDQLSEIPGLELDNLNPEALPEAVAEIMGVWGGSAPPPISDVVGKFGLSSDN